MLPLGKSLGEPARPAAEGKRGRSCARGNSPFMGGETWRGMYAKARPGPRETTCCRPGAMWRRCPSSACPGGPQFEARPIAVSPPVAECVTLNGPRAPAAHVCTRTSLPQHRGSPRPWLVHRRAGHSSTPGRLLTCASPLPWSHGYAPRGLAPVPLSGCSPGIVANPWAPFKRGVQVRATLTDLYAYILDSPVAIAQDMATNLARQVKLYEEEARSCSGPSGILPTPLRMRLLVTQSGCRSAELLTVAASTEASREARNASVECVFEPPIPLLLTHALTFTHANTRPSPPKPSYNDGCQKLKNQQAVIDRKKQPA